MPAPRGPIFFAVKEGKIVDESRDPDATGRARREAAHRYPGRPVPRQ